MTDFKHPSVIINLASGSTSDISEDIAAQFVQHNFPEPVIHAIEPEDLGEAFRTIADNGTDLLVIYGGDGTCKAGAEIARKLDIPLIALPGGTMNMLPKALYGTADWTEALSHALKETEPRWFPAGLVNDEIFFCGAIIGDPIKMSEARESLRDGDVIGAIKQLPEVVETITDGNTFTYKADGKPYEGETNLLHLSSPKKSRGNTLKFELVSIPRMTLGDVMDVGARAIITNWRESENVHVDHVETVSISGQGHFDILLDGESSRLSCPIKARLTSKGVKVLAPKNI